MTARDTAGWGPSSAATIPGCARSIVRASTLSLRGRYQEAKRSMAQALSLAEDLKHPSSQAHALANVLMAAQIGGDHPSVDQYAQRLIALADKYNLPPMRAHATIISGWTLAFASDPDAGVAVMEVEYPRASAVGPMFRYYAALLAEGQERAGRFADALTVLRPALQTVAEPGVGIFVPSFIGCWASACCAPTAQMRTKRCGRCARRLTSRGSREQRCSSCAPR